MKTKQLLLMLATASALVFSCKKDDENKTNNPSNNPSSSCSLTASMENDTGYVAFNYNTDGTIARITEKNPSSDTSKIDLTYANNIVSASVNGNILNTYYLNSKGYADSTVLDLSGFIHMSTINTYDANGYLITQNESINFLGTDINTSTTYLYSGGNVSKKTVESNGKTTVTTYEYYTDKNNKLANSSIDALFIGKANANLVKTETVDGVLANTYTYEYDSKGNPSKQIATDPNGVKDTFIYSWSCK